MIRETNDLVSSRFGIIAARLTDPSVFDVIQRDSKVSKEVFT